MSNIPTWIGKSFLLMWQLLANTEQNKQNNKPLLDRCPCQKVQRNSYGGVVLMSYSMYHKKALWLEDHIDIPSQGILVIRQQGSIII